MPRIPRVQQYRYGAYYHLMNRGHNREVVFRSDDDIAYFLKLVEQYRGRFDQHLYHYCFMNNHFHLLASCPEPAGLSKWMAGLMRSYVHYYNRRYGFQGHLWQGRFKSPVVGVEEYFLSCARYIERNPVRAGLVTKPWAYRWSSCRAYALGEENPLLHYNEYNVWYRGLGATSEERQARWREFLLGDDPHEEEIRRGDWVEGDGAKRRRMQQEGAWPGRRRGRPRKAPLGEEGYFPQFYEGMEDA
jgi:putative transposase